MDLRFVPMDANAFGRRVRETRRRRNMTQKRLATAIGVKASAVSQWETGIIKSVDAENLLGAARALKVDPAWLLYGDKGQVKEDTSSYRDADRTALDEHWRALTKSQRRALLEKAQEQAAHNRALLEELKRQE